MKIKLVITDIDGVWTDGGMYYDNTGNELKKFNTSDSAGVIFLKNLEIPLAIITGEDTKIVKRRAEKLKIDYIFLGVKNKLKVANNLCKELNISLSDNVAFIGDDINDVPLLKKVNFSCTPANAKEYVSKNVDFITKSKGGNGAFREFIEKILTDNNLFQTALERYYRTIE